MIQFLAALAILHQVDLNYKMNSTLTSAMSMKPLKVLSSSRDLRKTFTWWFFLLLLAATCTWCKYIRRVCHEIFYLYFS